MFDLFSAQICGFLAGLFHSRLIKRALIVAPKTLLPHWIKELSVVGLSEKTREWDCFFCLSVLFSFVLSSMIKIIICSCLMGKCWLTCCRYFGTCAKTRQYELQYILQVLDVSLYGCSRCVYSVFVLVGWIKIRSRITFIWYPYIS